MHFAGLVTTMSSPPVNFTCWTAWDTIVKFEFTLLVSVLVPICFIELCSTRVALSLDGLSEIVDWLAPRKF